MPFCYNGPRIALGYAPSLQYILLFCIVFYSKGRVFYQWWVSVVKVAVAVNHLITSEILELK